MSHIFYNNTTPADNHGTMSNAYTPVSRDIWEHQQKTDTNLCVQHSCYKRPL